MSNILEKKFFYLFIILQPILDLLTSFMSRNMDSPLTIGIIARSLFMVYMFMYALFIYRSQGRIYKYSRWILIGIGVYIITFLGYTLLSKDTSIITEIKGVIKLFYFPIVLTGGFILNEKDRLEISNKFLMYLLLGYTGVIFIATITGTYFRSYNEYLYGLGTVGWFFAANEIGSIIAILTPFTIINIIENKLNIVNIISIILCILSSLYMGTKVPFIGFIGSLGILMVYIIFTYIFTRIKKISTSLNYKKISVCVITVGIVFCGLFYKSPVYKNLMFNYGHIVHKIVQFIEEPKEENPATKPMNPNEEVVVVEPEEQESEEQELEINMHINQDDLVGSLLSNRTAVAEEIKNIYKNSSIVEKLVGLGHVIEIKPGISTDKTIEMDQLDIFYRHGIVGTILYFGQLIILMGVIIKSLFRNARYLLDLDVITCMISIFLGIAIAFSSGHVLTAPAVSIFIILSIIKLYNKVVEGN